MPPPGEPTPAGRPATVLVGEYTLPTGADPLCAHLHGGDRARITTGGEGTTRWARGGLDPEAIGASAS
jgi:hypothetical protein